MRLRDFKTKNKVNIGFVLPILLLVVLSITAYWSISRIVEANKWVQHTHKVIAAANGIVASAVDMETGMRGYLLAGQEEFLNPYNSGEEATYSKILELQKTVRGNPPQVERLAQAQQILENWQADVTRPTISLRREIGSAKTVNDMAKLVGEARGKVFFDAFREKISVFIENEKELLRDRHEKFESAKENVRAAEKQMVSATEWVGHTHSVIASGESILANAVDMETGMRGFLISGQDEFLEPYISGKQAFFSELTELKKTVEDNPPQVKRLSKAEALIATWIEQITEPAIELRREVAAGNRTLAAVEQSVNQRKGKATFDAFRVVMSKFSEVEADLIAERQVLADDAGLRAQAALDKISENEAWVTHTNRVIDQARQIFGYAVDMETGMRGYLLAGKENFLQPYEAGRSYFFDELAALKETVADNPVQVELLEGIGKTIDAWLKNVTEPTIALRRNIGDSKTMDDMARLVGQARGKKYFDDFRAVMAVFVAEEQALMQERTAANQSTVASANVIIVGSTVFALLISAVIAGVISSSIVRPLNAMTVTMKRLAAGDTSTPVQFTNRKDEIGEIGRAFHRFKKQMNNLQEQEQKEVLRQQALNREIRLMSELNEWLQSSSSLDELFQMISRFLTVLLPNSSGSIYVYSNSRDVLDGACAWNGAELEAHIRPDACWGLRRGRAYVYGDNEVNFSCDHVPPQDDQAYICMPILAHGETVGLMHLVRPPLVSKGEFLEQRKLAQMAAEQISMAIANTRMRDELHNQSVRDPLTGLYNRRHFMDSLRKHMDASAHNGQPVALVSIDVDHFKKFNDNHGHDAGDMVLRAVGAVLEQACDGDQLPCRLGGEEFMLLLPENDLESAAEIAEKLRSAVEAIKVRYGEKTLPRVTISAGVAAYPDHGTIPVDLMKSADEALYESKAGGRNQVTLASGQTDLNQSAETDHAEFETDRVEDDGRLHSPQNTAIAPEDMSNTSVG
jgi:diguanylate cyclase (GGDEF)-like protein